MALFPWMQAAQQATPRCTGPRTPLEEILIWLLSPIGWSLRKLIDMTDGHPGQLGLALMGLSILSVVLILGLLVGCCNLWGWLAMRCLACTCRRCCPCLWTQPAPTWEMITPIERDIPTREKID